MVKKAARLMRGGGCGCAVQPSTPNWSGGASNRSILKVSLIVLGIISIIALIAAGVLWLLPAYRSSQKVEVHVVSVPTAPSVTSAPNVLSAPSSRVEPTRLPRYDQKATTVQQVGLLTSAPAVEGGNPLILPLYGRLAEGRTDRYQYFSAGDTSGNMWRVPIKVDDRNCEDDHGCRELQEGDLVSVSVYGDRPFTTTMYRQESPRYFSSAY
jgi:hypothetical protein